MRVMCHSCHAWTDIKKLESAVANYLQCPGCDTVVLSLRGGIQYFHCRCGLHDIKTLIPSVNNKGKLMCKEDHQYAAEL